MYNLLAIVVSVAIGVFMSAAGVFYAGSTFLTASGKAQAMQLISSMEQIDAAWTLWNNDGNGTTGTTPATSGATGLTGTPNYLSAFPTPPSIAATWGGSISNNAYTLDYVGNGSTSAAAGNETANTGVVVVLNSSTGANACLEMARSAGVLTSSGTFTGTLTINWSGGPTNVALAGITSKADVDALAAVYRYFCVPLGVATININATALVAGDSTKYLAYFKHQ